MPSWRWEGNPSNESNNAMQDYMDILSGEVNYAEEFKKYNVQLVLFVTPKEDNLFSYLDKKLKNLIERFGKENKDFDFVETLENDGWEKVYEDDKAVIYQVPENFLK
jgi:hypothetical protein